MVLLTQDDIQPEVPVEVPPDALPLEEEEAGDDRVVEQAAVRPRLRHVPQRLRLWQRGLLHHPLPLGVALVEDRVVDRRRQEGVVELDLEVLVGDLGRGRSVTDYRVTML